jgi:hypothetical protein
MNRKCLLLDSCRLQAAASCSNPSAVASHWSNAKSAISFLVCGDFACVLKWLFQKRVKCRNVVNEEAKLRFPRWRSRQAGRRVRCLRLILT